MSAYNISLTPQILPDRLSFSDHAPFWDRGYPAILAIEDWDDHTPDYHRTTDRLGTLNMTYYTRFAKAALATFAHMGCLIGDVGGTVERRRQRVAAAGRPGRSALGQGAGRYQADGGGRDIPAPAGGRQLQPGLLGPRLPHRSP